MDVRLYTISMYLIKSAKSVPSFFICCMFVLCVLLWFVYLQVLFYIHMSDQTATTDTAGLLLIYQLHGRKSSHD